MVPLEGEMRKVKRESEEILVLFLGSGFGIVKLLSLRELTIRYLLSGYCTSVSLASDDHIFFGKNGLTVSLISAAAALAGTGSCRS